MPRPPRPYAVNTRVTSHRSAAQIQDVLERYGATKATVVRREDMSGVAFVFGGYWILSAFRPPEPGSFRHFCEDRALTIRTAAHCQRLARQETARLWRALLLVTKARLEAVASGIQTAEQAFLADIVRPEGGTMLDHVRPMLPDPAARDLRAS